MNKDLVEKCKLSRAEKQDMDEKWGEHSPGIGGINYCEHIVLTKAIPIIAEEKEKEWVDYLAEIQKGWNISKAIAVKEAKETQAASIKRELKPIQNGCIDFNTIYNLAKLIEKLGNLTESYRKERIGE